MKYGLDHLSDEELLALFIRNGIKDTSCIEIAGNLLDTIGSLNQLNLYSVEQLTAIKGISQIKAIELLGLVEFARRYAQSVVSQEELIVDHVDKIVKYMRIHYGNSSQEHGVIFYLDMKGRLIKEECLFIGSMNVLTFSIQELFKRAMLCDSCALIISHNHPLGKAKPSKADHEMTQKIKEVSELCDIRLVDHVIVSDSEYFSFAENVWPSHDIINTC